MTYIYIIGSNKISNVNDAANDVQEGFRAANGGYTYDNSACPIPFCLNYKWRGNLICNAAKGITIISYNHLNLPTNITITGGKTIDVTNAADGTKLRKVVKTGATINLVQVADPVSNVMSIGNASGRKLKKILSGGTTKSYIGSFEYVGTTVEAVYHSEGRARNNSGTYVYEYVIKDHLGNTRVMFTNISGGIAQIKAEVPRKSRYGVIGKNHYYPFGMPARPKSYGGGEQAGWIANPTPPYAYKYNGKELNIDFGLNLSDYGARWYDAGVGRFTSIDRYAPKYASLNPYQYGANNPIKYIDVNGDSLRINTGGGNYAYYDNGNVYNRDGSQYTGPGTKVRKDGSVRLKGELKATVNALNQISGGGTAGNELVSSLVGTTTTFTINQGDNRTQGLNVYFNSSSTEGGLDASGSNSRPAYIGLAHELAHALDIDRRTIDYNEWFKTETGVIRTNAEKFASNYENRIRSENGLSLRAYYSSGVYPPAALLNGPSAKYPTNYYNANSLPRREILSVSSSNQ